jgi:hypothetical protein
VEILKMSKYFKASYIVLVSKYYQEIKRRRMRWAGHLARIGEERKVYKV